MRRTSSKLACCLLGGTAVLCGVLPAQEATESQTGPETKMTAKPERLTQEQVMERLRQFHGHLGPYVVLGYRLGERLLGVLNSEKYTGLTIIVICAPKPPHTCLLDGLQISTGCTMGKQNLKLLPSIGGPNDPPFNIVARGLTGPRMGITVQERVPGLFKEWLETELTEEEVFHRVITTEATLLWHEELSGGSEGKPRAPAIREPERR